MNVPDGVRVERDIIYAKVGERELKLDLYLPKEAPIKPLPLIIWIHGGGWRNGSKDRTPAAPLAGKGYAVASVEYRLSGEAIFPAQVHDCKAAVRYLRKNAGKYGVDPKRFGVWGSSAGGHLVAMLGTSAGIKDMDGSVGVTDVSSEVQAVCDWFGPTDLLRMNDGEGKMDHNAADSPESRLIGGPIQEHKEKTAKANPINYITPDDPPFLIMHGDKDQLVIYNQSVLLQAALTKAGVESTLVKIEDGGHGFKGSKRPRAEIEADVEKFFDKVLKKK